jgi:predicted ATPase
MFRLTSININDWHYLGHIPEGSMVFHNNDDKTNVNVVENKIKNPFTTVLIGPNGTGKSTILAYIGRIFEDIYYFKANDKRNPNSLNVPYSIVYNIGKEKFQITQKHNSILDSPDLKERKNVRWGYLLSINDKIVVDYDRLKLPEQIIAVSYLAMDRFRQKKNSPEDFYQYLGLRHRSNAASPQYFLNNTLPLLFNYISENNSLIFLVDILKFMNKDSSYLGIQLEYRYKQYFFTENLTDESFKNLFENHKLFSKRESTPFAVEYYKRNIANNPHLIEKIVNYLNNRASQDNIKFGEKSLLEFNLFENIERNEELALIIHLQKLDLLTSSTLLFRNDASQNTVASNDLSSGEFHFLTTMIAIQSTIKENSLILIDEPDTSLHPNWQMKYIHNLKELFRKWKSSHFVLATHSHFLIGDLEQESSEIIGLTGQIPNIKSESFSFNTYGWTPDEILYRVFGLRTNRNYYFENDLLILAKLLNSELTDSLELKRIIAKLEKFVFSKDDPLNKLIALAKLKSEN